MNSTRFSRYPYGCKLKYFLSLGFTKQYLTFAEGADLTESRRKNRKIPITFEEWIEKKGVNKIAKHLGIHRATVLHWKAKRGNPKVEHLKKLKRLARGEIDYQQMIERGKPCRIGGKR